MSRPAVFLLAAFSTLMFAHSAAAGSIQGTDIERVLRRVADEQKKVSSLEATFSQEKTSSLFARPEVSSGTFVFTRPNKVLWTYDEPKRVEMLVADGWMTTYYPDLRRAEKIEIRRYEERTFKYLGAAAGAIADLEHYFNFTMIDAAARDHFLLKLDPKSARVAKRVKRIEVGIDRTSWLTTSILIEEGDGDVTSYAFRNVKVNTPIAPSRFQLTFPAGVRVETVGAQRSR